MKPKLSLELSQVRERLLLSHNVVKDLDAQHPLRQEYKALRSNYKKAIRQCKSAFFLEKLESSSNKAKTIWSAVNEFKNSRVVDSNISNISLTSDLGEVIQNPLGVANAFNTFFSNIGTHLSDSQGNVFSSKSHFTVNYSPKSMFLSHTNENEVAQEVMALKSKKSCGPDGISSHLLKHIKDLISKPLAHIINTSFEQGRFPDGLKLAIVRPVHKKGSRHDCDNYRPVSLISSLSKVFERVFLTRLLGFINKNNLLSRFQFGFTKGKCTRDAINYLVSSIVDDLDKGKSSGGIFFDLTKAFDVVDHSALLVKLERMGIRGNSCSWISSYLNCRKQVVHITYTDKRGYGRKAQSSVAEVLRGVPQGSVLGPVLFLLFVNDLPATITNGKVCLFADDTSLSVSANDHAELEVEAYMQANSLMQWFEENRLLVNEEKTQFIEFSINKRSSRVMPSLFLEDKEVQAVSTTKFLGVYIDRNLNFQSHIQSVCKRLGSNIFALRNLASFMNRQVLLSAYYGLIYPFLTYAVEIWGHECKRTTILFRLQKRALRIVFRKWSRFSCKQLFIENNILTFPCIYIHRVLLYVHSNIHIFRSEQPKHSYNLRLRNCLVPHKHKTAFFKKHLLYNGTILYSALPHSLRNESDVNKFARKSKAYLLSRAFYSVQEYLSSNMSD